MRWICEVSTAALEFKSVSSPLPLLLQLLMLRASCPCGCFPSLLFQSCLLYGGVRGVIDYGVVGYSLLENLRAALRCHFTSPSCPGTFWSHPSCREDEYDERELWNDYQEQGDTLREEAHLRENVFLVETAALGPVAMWRHSGHLELFQDDVVQCIDTGRLFR